MGVFFDFRKGKVIKMKKILSLIMALFVVASTMTSVFAEEKDPQIKVDGRSLTFREEQEPVIINDRLYVPVRRVLETMKSTVKWDESTRMVTVNSFDNVIVLKMTIDNPVITRYEYTSVLNADKTEITSDVAPIILNDRTMLPIRVIAEALGATVYFDEATWTTHITTKQIKRILDKESIDYSAENFMLAEAYKENLPKLSIDCDASGIKEGDEVKIKVKLTDIEKYNKDAKICSTTVSISYDSENFEYLGFTCVKDGEEKDPMLSADNGTFTDKLLKVVTLDMPENAYSAAEDGTVLIVNMKALNDKGGEFVLSDGHSRLGNDTELMLATDAENYEVISKYNELYIDTTPITVK